VEREINTYIVLLLLALLITDHTPGLANTISSLYSSMYFLILILSLLLLAFSFISTLVVWTRLADPFNTGKTSWIRQADRWMEKTFFLVYLSLAELATLAYYHFRPERPVGTIGVFTIIVMIVWFIYVLITERRTILRTMFEIVKDDPEAYQSLLAQARRA